MAMRRMMTYDGDDGDDDDDNDEVASDESNGGYADDNEGDYDDEGNMEKIMMFAKMEVPEAILMESQSVFEEEAEGETPEVPAAHSRV